VSNAVRAMHYAVANGADIINASFGGRLGGWSLAIMADAVSAAQLADVLVVAAAGNHGTSDMNVALDGDRGDNDHTPFYPASAAAPNVVSVAAIDRNDQLADFSNFGQTSVHLGALGAAIWSTLPTANKNGQTSEWEAQPEVNWYAFLSGTSMAAPHVAGAAALMLAVNPDLTASQLKNLLMTTADPLDALADTTISGGRLNLFAALQAAQQTPPGLTEFTPLTGANADQPFTITHGDLFANAGLGSQGFDATDIQFRIEGLGKDAPSMSDGTAVALWSTLLAAEEAVEWTSTVAGEAVTAFTVTALHDQLPSANPIPVRVDVERTVLSIAASDPDAVEGSDDTGAFTISRTGNLTNDLTMAYTIERVEGGASPPADSETDFALLSEDYDAESQSGSITIPAGEASVVLPVVPLDDDEVEFSEWVSLLLTEQRQYDVSEDSRGTVTIWDNETPQIEVYAEWRPDTSFRESHASESGNVAQFRVRCLGSREEELVVNYELTGTATNGDDYTLSAETIVFQPRSAENLGMDVYLTLNPIDDDVEGREDATLTLLPSDNYTIAEEMGTRQAIFWDNDADSTVPLVSIVVNDGDSKVQTIDLTEGGSTNLVLQRQTEDVSAPLEVTLRTGTFALTWDDVDLSIGDELLPIVSPFTVTIPAGATSQAIQVIAEEDEDVERWELLQVQVLALLSGGMNEIAQKRLFRYQRSQRLIKARNPDAMS